MVKIAKLLKLADFWACFGIIMLFVNNYSY